jgi:hypothetical protein
MNKILAILVLAMLSTDASAACISKLEKNVLLLRALVQGSVKVFVNHSELPLGTPVADIEAATEESLAQLNAGTTLVYEVYTWVPYAAPGFSAYVTSAGVQKLYEQGYCFGRID